MIHQDNREDTWVNSYSNCFISQFFICSHWCYFAPFEEPHGYLEMGMKSVFIIASRFRSWSAKVKKKLASIDTHQVVDAEEERLDAAIALTIPAGRDAQIYPNQFRQELQGEASQAVLRAPVQLKQLVAHRL